jgi:dipeptidyl-peptidase-4
MINSLKMQLHKTFLVLFTLSFTLLSAQNKDITLEEIWSDAFKTKSLERLHSMKNGTQYSVLNQNKNDNTSTVDVFDYKTSNKVKTIISSAEIEDIKQIKSYTFSADESKVLITTQLDTIYRHSRLGLYFVVDVDSKKTIQVSDQKIQEPTFSPDGSKIAYGFENNLYIKDLNSGETRQITADGKKNHIINGITDWVYEEEFSFVRAFDWNISGDKIAYIKFDETDVPEFSMDIYGNELYQTQQVFKYPKAGEKNAEVSLHIFDLTTNTTSKVSLDNYHSYYMPRLQWTKEAAVLSVQTMNRKQNELDLIFVNANTMSSNRVLRETDAAYVDITDNLTFLNDNSFIWTSEKSGWNHIYHYDKTGKLLNQVTDGNWEVTRYYGYDSKTNRIFYQSTENGSINRDVFAIGLNGKKKTRLTPETGTNVAAFSADFSSFINTFSSATTPPKYTLRDSKTTKVIREILNNNTLLEKLKNYKVSEKEYSQILINGNELNMYMIKPLHFDENKTYPLLLFQYSGPGSQRVSNSWLVANDYWHQMLAQQGYIVACVDGRGTGYKGSAFKKITQYELGKYEVEDQITFAKKLGERNYIDANRIGIWGWSYGGFMSSNALFQAPETFALAIAVAPVTSWRFYDTIYTERYMLTPQENPSGYDNNSPISHVEKLQGKFLLVHGSADDNVHLQNTMRLVEKLVQANKQFEWLVYPDKNHSIKGGNTKLHLYTKMTNFIKENL